MSGLKGEGEMMDKRIEELVYQGKELLAMISKTRSDEEEQLATLAKILTDLEMYNDPDTVTPKDYGVSKKEVR